MAFGNRYDKIISMIDSEKIIGEITQITRQVKNKTRVSIFVDGDYFGSLDEKTFLESALKAGDKITEDKWRALQEQGENQLAFNKAIGYISKLMRSEKQIREYLNKKGFEEGAVEYAIKKMREYKYIDDQAYAKMVLSHQINVKKSGHMAVEQALRKNGIPNDIAQSVMLSYGDDDEFENAKAQYEKLLKKYMREEDEKKKKHKIAQSMARKGYDWETVKRAARSFEAET